MMDRDFVRAALAEACARHFFETFDGNLGNLRDLYHEDAWMTFVGEKYQGRPAISAKFESLGLQHSQHSITSVDSHPMREDGAMFVQVLGHWNFTEAGGHQQIRNFCEA
ncbi:hypothetical protein EUGRSUZ_H04631 [Eucalyptus grandis]|uniref:Uncharacterized protein n=2 Tax=Eucalyptus grandis TaxID=71139 RepID=A0ACC3JXR5_EUCGR|nr:hypothetical protein EUGRSUZ_H04631 [Eucalyptus grandis]